MFANGNFFRSLFFNFSVVESSPLFEEFLDFLGTRIKLDNWGSFKGGLDVKSTENFLKLAD